LACEPANDQTEQEGHVMRVTSTNIVVDVKQLLSSDSGDQLLGDLSTTPGVTKAWVSTRARRLVLVDYDPRVIDSQAILDAVSRRGFDARLVGM
jgi:hypothetical protein